MNKASLKSFLHHTNFPRIVTFSRMHTFSTLEKDFFLKSQIPLLPLWGTDSITFLIPVSTLAPKDLRYSEKLRRIKVHYPKCPPGSPVGQLNKIAFCISAKLWTRCNTDQFTLIQNNFISPQRFRIYCIWISVLGNKFWHLSLFHHISTSRNCLNLSPIFHRWDVSKWKSTLWGFFSIAAALVVITI